MIAILSVTSLVLSGRVPPSRSFQFSRAAFNVASLPFSRWPRMDEFFTIDADEEPMPYSPPQKSRFYGLAERAETRGAAEPQEAAHDYSRGYFDDSFMPKSIVLSEEGSIESRFPFPTFDR